MTNRKHWGLLILSLFTVQLAQAQALVSDDQATTHFTEIRVEANFTKHFRIRGQQSVHLYAGEAIFSRPFESTYSKLDDATTLTPQYFRRSYTTVGVSYAPVPYVRIGAEYTLKIMGNKFVNAKTEAANPATEFIKHRATFFVTGTYIYDEWKFSLRERLDANIRMDSVNLHEKPKAELTLRHKLQAQYSVPGKPLKAYGYVELWNTLNQPVKYLNTYAGTNKDGTVSAYSGKTFGQYLSQVRVQIGVDWRLDKKSTLGFAYRYGYEYSRDLNITHNKGYIELTNAKSHGHYLVITYDLDW